MATRSARAASEIKLLIGRIVDRVARGTDIVEEAGRRIGETVEAIGSVNEIVKPIAFASHEQSQGVTGMSLTVREMDPVTQQNAAPVEESTAAAVSFRNQAGALVSAVSSFRLA